MGFLVPAILVALWLAPIGQARTFYVERGGSDAASGTTPAHAWRSLDRVDAADLRPGDRVLFRGGETFPGTLMPRASGAPRSPIVFASYGGGRARLASSDGAVWLPPGESYVTLSDLDLTSNGGSGSIVASSGSGAGSTGVSIVGCHIHDGAGVGVNAPKAADAGWLIAHDRIERTGDSGVIFLGGGFTVAHDAIVDTGRAAQLPQPKHAIYAKGPAATIEDNTIAHYQASGIDVRFRSTRVIGNHVGAGGIGIDFLEDDTVGGTTVIADNTVVGTWQSGIYVAPRDEYATHESFVITGNRVSTASGNGFDVERTTGTVTLQRNVVAGGATVALDLYRPRGRLVEGANTWQRRGGGAVVVFQDRTYGDAKALHAAGLGLDVFG